MIIQLPVSTELLEKIDDLNPRGTVKNKQILIEFDMQRRDYRQELGLSRKTKISWCNERTFDVQELSSFPWPILYRITTAEGYYKNESGDRVYFTPDIIGLSTYRKVSDVTCRLAVYLCVIAGLSSRQVSALMQMLGLRGFVWVIPQRSPLAIRTTLHCGREVPSGILPDFDTHRLLP